MTARLPSPLLRIQAPRRVLDGFGRSVVASCRFVAPRSVDELSDVVAKARREGLTVAFRGSGRSYGDASLNASGLVIDTTALDRVERWEPSTGVLEAGPGLTIEGLWRRTIEDGYWPHVVPGTMRPTMAGCISMNIHGKNNFKAGPFGDHVLGLELMTPSGDRMWCSRDENSEVFHAVIGGLGMLGAVTRVKLKLKKVQSGRMRILPISSANLDEMFAQFREHLPHSDYLVGWVDCLSGGSGIGRGEIHRANYLSADEDPMGQDGFHVESQGLPSTILGVSKGVLWRFMQPALNNLGVRFVNSAKYYMAKLGAGRTYLQSHVGFAFLLDYVPNWRLAYGDGGFIQYQVFVPDQTAAECMKAVLRTSQEAGLPPYLGVLKRPRPDAFLLSHALDGWSMAMDFRVTASNRDRLWKLTERLTAIVLEAGGRFYFAKDAVLRPDEVVRAYGAEKFEKFAAIKQQLDPENLLQSDLWRRVRGLPA